MMLVLDGFTRREFDEAPSWQAGLRFWMSSPCDQLIVVTVPDWAKVPATNHPGVMRLACPPYRLGVYAFQMSS
jgi:hypothetical protein